MPTPVTTDATKKTGVNKATEAPTDDVQINVQEKNESVDIFPLNSTETTQSVTYVTSTKASNVKNTSSTGTEIACFSFDRLSGK